MSKRAEETTPSMKKTPEWLIERAAQGEFDGAETAELRTRLAAEGRSLDDELEALRRSNRDILAQLPRETLGPAIRQRAAQTKPEARFHILLLRPLALAGALGLLVLVARGVDDHESVRPLSDRTAEVTTIKGDALPSPRLLVYRQRPGGTAGGDHELLRDGARGARGDLLQLAYDKAPEGRYGVLISLDGAGRITQHLPEEGVSQAPPLIPVREFRLPSAYELDDAPGFERFVLVTASQPFATKAVIVAAHILSRQGAAARLQALPLPTDFTQTSLSLNKMREGTP